MNMTGVSTELVRLEPDLKSTLFKASTQGLVTNRSEDRACPPSVIPQYMKRR